MTKNGLEKIYDSMEQGAEEMTKKIKEKIIETQENPHIGGNFDEFLKEEGIELGKRINKEDLSYLQNLNNNISRIKEYIGELEIQKINMLQEYRELSSTLQQFSQQLKIKYEIDANEFKIDNSTGEIK